jgi:hypothetical protein
MVKSLFSVNQQDIIYEKIIEARQYYNQQLIEILSYCQRYDNLSTIRNNDYKIRIKTDLGGDEEIEVIKHIKRILNALKRSPIEQSIYGCDINEDSSNDLLIKWFQPIARNILEIKAINKTGEAIINSLAQIAEKGCSKDLRQKLQIPCLTSNIYDDLHAKIFEDNFTLDCKIESGASYVLNQQGDIVYAPDKSVSNSKSADLIIITKHFFVFTSNKANTSLKKGGSRDSEYQKDLGNTINYRTNKRDKGIQLEKIKNNGETEISRWVIVVGLVDSRYINTHANTVIPKLQDCCNNQDTFISDTASFARFLNEIEAEICNRKICEEKALSQDFKCDITNIIACMFDKLAHIYDW